MNFSFQTVFNTILVTNLLVLFITCIFSRTEYMVRIGHKLLFCGILVIVLRLFIPFEFFFTKNVYLPKPISYMMVQLLCARFGTISLWDLFVVVWIAGILYGCHAYCKERKKLHQFILENSVELTHTSKYQELLNELCKNKKACRFISIYQTSNIGSPMICGMIHPKILLPKSLLLSDAHLRYVLSHELSHYFHQDLFLKFVVQVLCIVYWWNPLCRTLQRQADTILEIRTDYEITQDEHNTKADYFGCLLGIAKQTSQENRYIPHAIYYSAKNYSILQRRFEYALSQRPFRNRIYHTPFVLFIVAIYLVSYLFILEPSYVSPEVEATSIGMDSPHVFYILDENGIYHIYLYGEHVETTDSLKYYEGIRPYDGEEPIELP